MVIEPDGGDSVKGTDLERLRLFAAQASFPVLALAADAQHAAFVCLSARLMVLDAHTVTFRGLRSRNAWPSAASQEFNAIARARAPATLVVDAEPVAALDSVAAEVVERSVASAGNMRVRRISLRSANARIVVDAAPTFRNAARVLLGRYEALGTRLAPDGKLKLRDHTVWRKHRALAAAFCLAHAFALEAVTQASRPFARRPPPPTFPI